MSQVLLVLSLFLGIVTANAAEHVYSNPEPNLYVFTPPRYGWLDGSNYPISFEKLDQKDTYRNVCSSLFDNPDYSVLHIEWAQGPISKAVKMGLTGNPSLVDTDTVISSLWCVRNVPPATWLNNFSFDKNIQNGDGTVTFMNPKLVINKRPFTMRFDSWDKTELTNYGIGDKFCAAQGLKHIGYHHRFTAGDFVRFEQVFFSPDIGIFGHPDYVHVSAGIPDQGSPIGEITCVDPTRFKLPMRLKTLNAGPTDVFEKFIFVSPEGGRFCFDFNVKDLSKYGYTDNFIASWWREKEENWAPMAISSDPKMAMREIEALPVCSNLGLDTADAFVAINQGRTFVHIDPDNGMPKRLGQSSLSIFEPALQRILCAKVNPSLKVQAQSISFVGTTDYGKKLYMISQPKVQLVSRPNDWLPLVESHCVLFGYRGLAHETAMMTLAKPQLTLSIRYTGWATVDYKTDVVQSMVCEEK